ncbi:DUF6531 domain-containing protein [Streptomyces sp. NPDC056944]|uniref:DUF6531 domain-containing protein n=1 Tax=Streptomyces sp. NPDC056944 TaxID=3345972 RepID=UPI00364233AC
MAVTVPDWADTLLDLIGVAWPNVDEDAYREMADALREFADDLEDDGQLANNHFERLLSSGQGESMDALNEHWSKVKGKHFKDIAGAARTIAGGLDTAAGAIEGMKVAALVQLGYLAAEAGIAISLIPVTFGLSSLIGAGAMRATQEVVKRLIKECVEEAVGYVMAALTEPAVAALEGMAADLVVQLGAVAIGLQDGVDLDQTEDAGRDGFKEGVQSGKEAMNLASAGPGSGSAGSGLKNLHIEHAEHTHASTQLNGVSVSIHGKTTGKLTKAKTAHGRTRGRDSIADAIDPIADKAMEALTKAAKSMGDHVGQTLPKVVKQISVDHKNTDDDLRDRFARQRKGDHDDGGAGKPGPGGPASGRKTPDSALGARDEARRNGIPLSKKTCENDPVDVVTGEMTLPQTDLSLPGVLPLVLRRTHLSEYRYGHWFGRSWASTLDERLELAPDGHGAVWTREDGSVLVYPRVPLPDGEPVLPLEGPRLALAYGGRYEDETTYTVTDPRSGLTRHFAGSPYRVSAAHWLTAIEDRHHNRVTFSRRPDGAPASVGHDCGYTVLLSTGEGRVREMALRTPEGPVTVMSYAYDSAGDLTSITDSSGIPRRFGYDAHGRITSWTDRTGSTFGYAYDPAGRVVRTLGPDGFLSSAFAHDVAASETRYTNSTGATTTYRYNEQLQVVSVTGPLGHTVRQAWDRHDRILLRVDALGGTTRYTYDDRGELVGITHPDSSTAAFTRDASHRLTSVTAADGSTWRQEYDESGSPTVFTRPDGATVRLTYDASGHLTGSDDTLGSLERVRCDAAGLPLAVRTQLGSVTRYQRDAFGRPVRITDPHGRTTVLEWSVEGRLTRRTDPDGTERSWVYDGEGNCVLHTDGAGGETRFEYTHFDLVAARTDPDGARHAFAYDTELRLTGVTGPQGLRWTYTYDAAGRLTAERDFDGRSLTYAYDPLGRLTSRTNGAGQTVRYERDLDGRVRLKDADGAVTRFSYDAAGRLTRAVGPDADLSYVRDTAGRVLEESCNGRVLAHAYDETGRRVRRTTPSGAVSTLSYPPDHSAVLDTAGHRIVFEFDEAGRETVRRVGETLTLEHAYDDAGRLTDQSVRGPGRRAVQRRSYTYRADGHAVSVDDLLDGPRRFELTGAGRVTGVTGPDWHERYAYDEAGNQTEAHWPRDRGASGPREYTGTRVRRAGAVRYEHDAQGRVVLRQKARLSRGRETWRYAWDAEDRLVGVTTPDGTRWRYIYDPLGRRIGKRRLAADGDRVVERTDFTWDGDVLVEQSARDGDSAESIALTWEHDGVKPVTQVERRFLGAEEVDRRFFAVVTDLVGTPRELVDSTGAVAWRTRTTLWGSTSWNRDATAYTPLRFPGQYFDPESQLHYNRHRHYDPEVGRYASPDPLGLAPAPHPVTYVDNPTTWIDPLGLEMCPHRASGEHRHSVVLGPNQPPPNGPSNNLARYLRNDPDDPEFHDPERPRDPGAHTYNGSQYAGGEPPDWMTNVAGAVNDRGTTLSITLDGMPNARGENGHWNTPESIVEAFQEAARFGSQFNMLHRDNYPPAGVGGTAWEMSVVALAVRNYDGSAAWGDPEDERLGRPWEEIHWYSNNERIDVPKPDIPEIQPDLSKLPKHKR